MAEKTLSTPAKKWAREYETVYILRPDVDPDEAEKVAGRIKDVMETAGGKFTEVDLWGKRRLAYPIKKFTRGIYVYYKFVGNTEIVAEQERNLRLLEPVIRYQTVKLRDFMELGEVSADAANFERIEHDENEAPELTKAQRLGLEAIDRGDAPSEEEGQELTGSEEE